LTDVSSLVHQTLLGEAWEHAAVAVAVFSDDGRYLACNEAFCALSGFGRAEILRMRVGVDLAPPGDAHNHELFRAFVSAREQVGEGDLRRKDGSVVHVRVWAIEARAAGLPYYVVLYWPASQPPDPAQIGP
jgi:PAS domain S-box-containing protein